MAGAANVYVHHDKDGSTMRTPEIPGRRGPEVVTWADVAPLHEPGVRVPAFHQVTRPELLWKG
jgi:hypothetical protein